MKHEGFIAWRDRVLGYLTQERPDVRKLLLCAEVHNRTSGAAEEQRGASSAGVHGNVCHIMKVISESLTTLMSDSLLSRGLLRARAVAKLHTKIHNDVCQCKELLEALPSWEQLGSEAHEWVEALALDKLVPQEQLSVMVSRPERADYGPKLLGSRYRWNTHVGATQAQRVSAVTIPKWDRDGDVHVGAVLQDASSRAANAQERHCCCGTSKEDAPSLPLAVTGTVSTC